MFLSNSSFSKSNKQTNHYLLENTALMPSVCSVDSYAKDTISIDTEKLKKISKIISANILLAQAIKKDYPSLFKIQGYHPMVGYSYQGIGSLSFGIARGTRSVFRPLSYQNIHANAMLFLNTSPLNTYGLNVGYTKSKALTYWGIEGISVRNKEGEITYAIRPEIGFSVLGVLNIGYGYNLIFHQNYSNLSTHTFVIRYTQQSPKKAIKKKMREINYILNRDYQNLKNIGLDIKGI